jgi:hypothetical protein
MAMITDNAPTSPSPVVPVILRDGQTAWLRPARPDDVERLDDLFRRASMESRRLRFFNARRDADRRLLERMAAPDGVNAMTYVVTRGEGAEESVVAAGSYQRTAERDAAEVAFFVDDAY